MNTKNKVLSLLLVTMLLTGLVLPLTAFADGETYTVSFDPGTGTGSMEAVTVGAGESYTLPACTFTHANSERAFYRWSVGGELKAPGEPITVNADTTVTAKWQHTTSTTIDNAVDSSTTTVVSHLILRDTRTGTEREEDIGSETTASAFTNPSSPTVEAMIDEAQEALAQKAREYAGESTVTTLNSGVSSLKADEIKDDRTFPGAIAIDDAGDYCYYTTIEGDYSKKWQYTVTLEAEYESPAPCTVSFDPGTGTGAMDPATVTVGAEYTLPACTFTHTNSERTFYKWSVGGELKDPGDTITVSADTTVTALWVYTASSSLVNNTQDNSTTNYVGKLVLTDTRTGETVTEELYNETVASTYSNPMNSDVASLAGNCVSTLNTALYSYPNANFLSDDKPTLDADHAEVVDSWNHITYRFEEAPDEAGDYVRTMYMEGDYGNAWRFTETVTGEYTSPEPIPSVSMTFTPPAVGTTITVTDYESDIKPVLALPEGETRYFAWGGYPEWMLDEGDDGEGTFTIEAGKTYSIFMELMPEDGYCFDDNTTVSVTNATVGDITPDGEWVMTIVFSFTAAGGDPTPTPDPIEEVVLLVARPTVGETTETEGPDVTAGDWKYEVTDAVWVDSAGNALPSPLVFESGATYYISATVTSYWDWDSTYFFPQSGMTVTVENGGLVGAPSITNISGAASTMQVLIAVQAVVKRPVDQIQVWVGSIDGNTMMTESGGKVATTYTPSEPNIYDFGKDGTFYAGDIVQFYPGDEIAVTAQADAGHRFVGWYPVNIDYNMSGGDTDHNGVSPNMAYMGSAISTAASFTYKPGETVVSGDTEALRYVCAVFEEDSTPSHTANEIQVWIGDAAGNEPGDSYKGGKVAVLYTPSYDDYPEDVAAKDGTEFGYSQIFGCYVGDEVTLYAQPDTGYRFVGWYLADGAWPAHGPEKYTGDMLSDQTSYIFALSSTNRLICAVFEAVQPTYTVTVTASPAAGGTVSGGGTFDAGSSVTVTATPSTGYRFVNWTEGGAQVSTEAGYAFTVTADRTLTANFALIPVYTVTIATDGGSVLADQTVAEGGKVTLPADPVKEGSVFAGWYGDAAFTTAFDFTAPITADTTVYARWTPASYVLTSVAGTTADAAHTWTKGSGSDVVLTVKLNDGIDHSFTHFTGVQIDGAALVSGTDYSAEEGSTVVTLKAAALERLSTAVHTVKVLFDNGEVSTALTVAAAAPTPTATPAPTPTATPAPTAAPTATPAPTTNTAASPRTGDDTAAGVWSALTLVSGLALAGLALIGRRRRTDR